MKTLLTIIILLLAVYSSHAERGKEPFISGAVNSTVPAPYFYSHGPSMANLNNGGDSSNSKPFNFFALAETTPSKFGINNLNSASITAGYLYSDYFITRFGFSGITNDLFSEYSAKAAGSYIFQSFALGIEADYSSLTISEFNSYGYLSLNIGGIISIDNNMNAGFRLTNINGGSYPGDSAPVYRELSAGMSFDLGNDLLADINAILLLERSSGISAALAYNFQDLLQARIAYLTNPETAEISLWYSGVGHFSIAYTLNYHTFLGFSNKIGAAWMM